MRAGGSLLRLVLGASGASVVNLAISVIAGVVLARVAGPAGTGFMNLALTISTLVAALLGAGTGIALRLTSAGSPDPTRAQSYLGFSALMVPIAALLTALIFVLAIGEKVGLPLGLAVAALGGASLAAKQSQELAQAHGDVMRSIRSIGIGTSSRILLLLAIAWWWAGDLTALACAFVIGIVVQGLYAGAPFGAVAGAQLGFRELRQGASRRQVHELVRAGRPSLGYSLGIMGLQRTDRLVIAALLTPRDLGLYAVAATLAEIMRVATAPLGQLVFVQVSKDRRVTLGTGQVVLLGVVGQVLIGAVLWFAAPWLITTFYTGAFDESAPLVRGLIVAEVFMGLVLIESRAVLGLGALRRMGTTTLVALGLAVPLYAVLISQYGLLGAISASVVAYALYALATHLALVLTLREL